MAKVTGQLTDFGMDPRTAHKPVVVFMHSTAAVAGARLLSASMPVTATTTANGFFEADLVPAAAVSPAGWYTITIKWTELPSKLRRTERLPFRLFVPAEGGTLADMLRMPSNPGQVWAGEEPPANPSPGTWWLDFDGGLHERGKTGWNFKQNLRGPAGYMATGAADDLAALASYVKETAGANVFSTALANMVTTRMAPALAATEAALAKARADTEAALDEARAEPLKVARFDTTGAATLATLAGRARARYEDTAERVERWDNLDGVAGSNGVMVAGNRLTTPALSATPSAAKIAWKPGQYGIARAVLNYVPGDSAMFFGVAGTDPNPRAGSSDALMVGIRATGTPGRVRGTDVGGTGQADFAPDPLPAGRYLATVTVMPAHIGFTLKSLDTLQEWGRVHPRTDMDPVGGIGHILVYAGWRSGGGESGWEPVTYSSEPTTGKLRTVGALTVRGLAPSVLYGGQNGDTWRIQLPANHDPRVPTPLVLWLHNNSGTATNGATDARMKPLMDALSSAGYLVASADAGGSAWGNDASRAQYRALYEFMRERYAVSSVVLLGVSMGGQVALNLLPRLEIPNVAAYVGVGAVASLDNLWTSYRSSITPAFDIAANGSDYETKTAGYRPEDRAGHEFRGVPMMFVHSPDDLTCDIAATRALAAKVAPFAPEAVVVESTGAHLAAAQFTAAVSKAIPFMQRYAPTK